MPKQTFLNLSEGKKKRILNAALREFSSGEFPDANLDRIALQARISKGSLYQYFNNKDDLFDHVSEIALKTAWQLFQKFLEARPLSNCFDMLVRTFEFIETLHQEEPHISKLYYRIGFSKKTPRQERRIVELNDRFIQQFIGRGRSEGLIDKALDDDSIRFLIDAVSNRFQERVIFPARLNKGGPGRRSILIDNVVRLIQRALTPQA